MSTLPKEFNEITSELLDNSTVNTVEDVKFVCGSLVPCEKRMEIFDLYEKIKDTDFFKKVFDGKFSLFVLYASKPNRGEYFKKLVLSKAFPSQKFED